jgi:hypothetical protein
MLLEKKKKKTATTKKLKNRKRQKLRSGPASARVYIRFLKGDERQTTQKYT